jgi:hypothetical protein
VLGGLGGQARPDLGVERIEVAAHGHAVVVQGHGGLLGAVVWGEPGTVGGGEGGRRPGCGPAAPERRTIPARAAILAR